MKKRNLMKEFKYITDKKERRDEIKALLRRHEENIIRRDMIKFHELGDEDKDIGGMDYSSVRVQSSNKSDISDQIIRREKELEALEYEIQLVEMLIRSVRGKKKDRDLIIVNEYLIGCKSINLVADKIFVYDTSYFGKLVNNIVDKMVEVLI